MLAHSARYIATLTFCLVLTVGPRLAHCVPMEPAGVFREPYAQVALLTASDRLSGHEASAPWTRRPAPPKQFVMWTLPSLVLGGYAVGMQPTLALDEDPAFAVLPPGLIPAPILSALFAVFMAILLIFTSGSKKIKARRFRG